MRAFLISISLIVVISVVSLFALGAVQKLSGAAYSTEGVRVSSSSFRRIAQTSMEKIGLKTPVTNTGGLNTGAMQGSEGEDTCREVSAWQTIFIDFGNRSEDAAACNF